MGSHEPAHQGAGGAREVGVDEVVRTIPSSPAKRLRSGWRRLFASGEGRIEGRDSRFLAAKAPLRK